MQEGEMQHARWTTGVRCECGGLGAEHDARGERWEHAGPIILGTQPRRLVCAGLRPATKSSTPEPQ